MQREQNRKYIVQEIYGTEDSYVKSLEKCIKYFMDPLVNQVRYSPYPPPSFLFRIVT